MRTNKKIQGYTLIELMIALAMGLLVVLLVYGFAIGLNRSQHFNHTSSELQTKARFIFDQVGRHIMAAGYYDPLRSGDASTRVYLNFSALTSQGNDPSFNELVQALPNDRSNVLPIQVVPTTGIQSEVIVSPDSYDPTLEDYITCDGVMIQDLDEVHAVLNVFWLQDDNLYCRSAFKRSRRTGYTDPLEAERVLWVRSRSEEGLGGSSTNDNAFANQEWLVAEGVQDIQIELLKQINGSYRYIQLEDEGLTSANPGTDTLGKHLLGIKVAFELTRKEGDNAGGNLANDFTQTFTSFYKFRNTTPRFVGN